MSFAGFLALRRVPRALGKGALAIAIPLVAPSFGCDAVSASAAYAADAGPTSDDASDADAGPTSPADASACRPGDVQTYVPPPYHAAAPPGQGACGSGTDLLAQFFDACVGPHASADACKAFAQDQAACARCMLSAATSDRYGPLVDASGLVLPNVSGCIELLDPAALSCAKSMQALRGCELAACQANCPVQDPSSFGAYFACAAVADATGCLSYATASATCARAERAGPAAACFIPVKDYVTAVGLLFCGPPPPDAASPPGDGGAVPGDATAPPGDASGPADAASPSDAALPSDAIAE